MLLILKKLGYECAGTTSSQQALELVRTAPPVLILLDDMMLATGSAAVSVPTLRSTMSLS